MSLFHDFVCAVRIDQGKGHRPRGLWRQLIVSADSGYGARIIVRDRLADEGITSGIYIPIVENLDLLTLAYQKKP